MLLGEKEFQVRQCLINLPIEEAEMPFHSLMINAALTAVSLLISRLIIAVEDEVYKGCDPFMCSITTPYHT